MRIYTSYFAIANKLPKDLVQVSISLFPPKHFAGKEYKKIVPTQKILFDWKRLADKERYIREYQRDVLSKLDEVKVYKELEKLGQGKDVVLLCYEKSEDFCHRHLFAKWMSEKGFEVNEINYEVKL